MPGCLPEYFVDDDFRPDEDIPFVPGSTPCSLISINQELKARLEVAVPGGGSVLFRARKELIGVTGDDITVQVQWLTSGGSPVETVDCFSAAKVKITISHPDYTTETHTENQTINCSPLSGSPNGITTLRSWVNANSSIVEMPTDDTDANSGMDNANPNATGFLSGADDGNYMPYFGPTTLSGGTGDPPADPITAGVRTGPIYAFYHVFSTEYTAGSPDSSPDADATLQVLNEKRVWDGTSWVTFNAPTSPTHVYVPNGENRDDPIGSNRFVGPFTSCP